MVRTLDASVSASVFRGEGRIITCTHCRLVSGSLQAMRIHFVMKHLDVL